jgi:plastocyanin
MKGLPHVRRLITALALVSLLAALGASFALARSTKSVRLGDNFFTRGALKIKRGTAVHWSWSHTANVHNVTSKRGVRFHSRTGHSGSFTFVFRKRGTFTIICTKHPTQMRMTIRVS